MKRGPMPHFNMMYELYRTKDITQEDLEEYKFCIFCNDVVKNEVEVEKTINGKTRVQTWDFCTACNIAIYPKWFKCEDDKVYVHTDATFSDYYPRKEITS